MSSKEETPAEKKARLNAFREELKEIERAAGKMTKHTINPYGFEKRYPDTMSKVKRTGPSKTDKKTEASKSPAQSHRKSGGRRTRRNTRRSRNTRRARK